MSKPIEEKGIRRVGLRTKTVEYLCADCYAAISRIKLTVFGSVISVKR